MSYLYADQEVKSVSPAPFPSFKYFLVRAKIFPFETTAGLNQVRENGVLFAKIFQK